MYPQIVNRFNECKVLIQELQDSTLYNPDKTATVFFKINYLIQVLDELEVWDNQIENVYSNPSDPDYEFISTLIETKVLEITKIEDYKVYMKDFKQMLETTIKYFIQNENDENDHLYFSMTFSMISYYIKNELKSNVYSLFRKVLQKSNKLYGLKGLYGVLSLLSEPFGHLNAVPTLIKLKLVELVEKEFPSKPQSTENRFDQLTFINCNSILYKIKKEIFAELQDQDNIFHFNKLNNKFKNEYSQFLDELKNENKEEYKRYSLKMEDIWESMIGWDFLSFAMDPWEDNPTLKISRQEFLKLNCRKLNTYYHERFYHHYFLLSIIFYDHISLDTIKEKIDNAIVLSKLLSDLERYEMQGALEIIRERTKNYIIIDTTQFSEKIDRLQKEISQIKKQIATPRDPSSRFPIYAIDIDIPGELHFLYNMDLNDENRLLEVFFRSDKLLKLLYVVRDAYLLTEKNPFEFFDVYENHAAVHYDQCIRSVFGIQEKIMAKVKQHNFTDKSIYYLILGQLLENNLNGMKYSNRNEMQVDLIDTLCEQAYSDFGLRGVLEIGKKFSANIPRDNLFEYTKLVEGKLPIHPPTTTLEQQNRYEFEALKEMILWKLAAWKEDDTTAALHRGNAEKAKSQSRSITDISLGKERIKELQNEQFDNIVAIRKYCMEKLIDNFS